MLSRMSDTTPSGWAELLKAGLLLFGGGTLGAVFTPFFQRKKTYAESQKILSEATLDYAESLKEDLVGLRETFNANFKDLNETRQRLEQAEEKSRKLEEIVRISQERDEKNMELIAALAKALRAVDPNNPILPTLTDVKRTPSEDMANAVS
jgi:hypothetical protein